MTISLFDHTDTVDIQPMTEREAAAWEMGVGNSAHQLRLLLFEGYQRRVWEALGHATWSDCLRAIAEKYEFSERHMWRLHSANETEKLLTHGSVGAISERVLRPLVALEPERQVEVYDRAVEFASNGKPTAADVQRARDEYEEQAEELASDEDAYDWADEEPPKPHVTRNSGNNEWHTPSIYVEAARRVLGAIELDPASNDAANETVQAETYYTAEDDGLLQDWFGTVFMNPPYSNKLVGEFIDKLVYHIGAGDVPAAIVLVNNATETIWFQTLAGFARAICFPSRRIRFVGPNEKDQTGLQGQAFVYIGNDPHAFVEEFGEFGFLVEPL